MSALKIYIVTTHPDARIPVKCHPGDAGWDLFTSRNIYIPKGEARDVHTDIQIALPAGWYANIKPRSSTLVRHGLEVIEGVVDQGYRGELFIQVRNVDKNSTLKSLEVGTRIAQLLILPVPDVDWVTIDHLPTSHRGTTGFGQSGR